MAQNAEQFYILFKLESENQRQMGYEVWRQFTTFSISNWRASTVI